MLKFCVRKLHASWILAWCASAIIGGIALAFWLHSAYLAAWPLVVVAACLIFIALVNRSAGLVVLAVAGGLMIGLWRGENIYLETINYRHFIGQTITLSGHIDGDISHKNGEAGLKLSGIKIDGTKLGGKVWASTNSSLPLKRGDEVKLSGKLQPGFGSYAASLSYATLTAAARRSAYNLPLAARDAFAAGLRRAVPEPQATIGLGYLTGEHSDLPEVLTKQMQLVGLIHLVIAGGYNVTILVRFARRFFMRYSKYLAIVAAASILLAITLMAGFTAPMARTAVVTGLCLATWYYGRRTHPLVLLPVAAAITALADPTFVWGDVGWYLTFVAYGGLIMLAPMLKKIFWDQNDSGIWKQILVDTLAVQIVTMPLMAFAFGQYSIYSLPANLLVLPLMPLTMLATLLAGIGGALLPAGMAHIVGWPASALLGYTEKVTNWLANASGAGAGASFGPITLALMYLAIIFASFVLWRRTRYRFASENIVE